LGIFGGHDVGLESVEIGEEVGEVLRIDVAVCGHEAVALQDGYGHAVVIGGSAAGKVLLFVEAEQRWAVEGIAGAVVVTLCAVSLEDGVAVELLGVELIERGWGRGGMTA
jgi:hypothetical protein